MELGLQLRQPARDEQPLLERLLQLYLHDFSAFAPIGSAFGELSQGGLFPYHASGREEASLADYWTNPSRIPLLTEVDGRIAGFVLIARDWTASGLLRDHTIAEFFVARKYRRAGVGTEAARQAFRRFPGTWEVPVASYNAPAQAFWRAALAGLPGLAETAGDGTSWTGPIFSFDASDRSLIPDPAYTNCPKC